MRSFLELFAFVLWLVVVTVVLYVLALIQRAKQSDEDARKMLNDPEYWGGE